MLIMQEMILVRDYIVVCSHYIGACDSCETIITSRAGHISMVSIIGYKREVFLRVWQGTKKITVLVHICLKKGVLIENV